MISKLTLKNFKLFQNETEIKLSGINLFTGINGSGKSTVLQSLLLMKQSPEFNRTSDKIIFNGSYIQLGSFTDVKNNKSSFKTPIEFKFDYSLDDLNAELLYQFNTEEPDSLDAYIDRIAFKDSTDSDFKDIYTTKETLINHRYLFNLFPKGGGLDKNIERIGDLLNFSRIHYISADRIGPKLYYDKRSLNEFASVGALSDNTINVLWHKKDDIVPDSLCYDKDSSKTVYNQLELWLNFIFDGAKLNLDEVPKTNLLTLKISTNNTTEYFTPTNVGFGYSYILPILISGLIAKKGEIIIIENPEAHLHPAAQSNLSKFLTLVSLNGIQIFIESHSEHVLNGLRIEVYDKVIQNKDLNILYFDKNIGTIFKEIKVEEDGGIKDWPTNFFDQATKDLNYLFGI
jgi:predicted ATPase